MVQCYPSPWSVGYRKDLSKRIKKTLLPCSFSFLLFNWHCYIQYIISCILSCIYLFTFSIIFYISYINWLITCMLLCTFLCTYVAWSSCVCFFWYHCACFLLFLHWAFYHCTDTLTVHTSALFYMLGEYYSAVWCIANAHAPAEWFRRKLAEHTS